MIVNLERKIDKMFFGLISRLIARWCLLERVQLKKCFDLEIIGGKKMNSTKFIILLK